MCYESKTALDEHQCRVEDVCQGVFEVLKLWRCFFPPKLNSIVLCTMESKGNTLKLKNNKDHLYHKFASKKKPTLKFRFVIF